jgi:hypothetical protein
VKHGKYTKRANSNRKLINDLKRDWRLQVKDPEAWAIKHGIDVDALLADAAGDDED